MVEYNMRSWGRAQTAAKLIIRKEFLVDDVVTAAEECGDLRRSEVFLKQTCSVCFIDLPRNKVYDFFIFFICYWWFVFVSEEGG